MLYAIVSILISVGFLLVSIKGSRTELSQKTMKITNGISKLLLVSPLIAAAVFAVLFCTVLTGRPVERSSHALIVFCLWLYGTLFYVNILRYFKSKPLLFTNLAGMMVSVAFAIILTPLDGAYSAIFETFHELTYLFGGIMLALWFFAVLKFRITPKKQAAE
ncbi:MAG: hypothetical protein IJT87_07795 [Ruminiclostridium sp.]|nr:hypothetical protein [Ruminiclostridium sp.]